ncbi:MAG: DUF3108 domain-containing protein [Caldithrix sp.]|nr:DUF3108 domain-containing protein [Caldithrix sp.]
MVKFYFVFLIIFFLIVYPSKVRGGESASVPAFQWQIGEQLQYKVKWAFIRLGTLTMHVKDTIRYNGKSLYQVILKIDSNPKLFFVDMHNQYESYIDDQFTIHRHISTEKEDGNPFFADHRFNYEDSTVYLKMTDPQNHRQMIEKQLPMHTKLFDGITMAFYSRANASQTMSDTLTTFILENRGLVEINFSGQEQMVEVEALTKPVSSYYIDGQINVEGIAGVTGPFKGWFAANQTRPPLQAKLKVFIGHVTVELEDYNVLPKN